MGIARPTEASLIRAALDLLALRGIPAFRLNTGAAKIGKRLVRFGSKGLPDILGILPDGRFLGCEIKCGTTRTTPEQKAAISAINTAGGLAFIARSLEDIDRALTAEGY